MEKDCNISLAELEIWFISGPVTCTSSSIGLTDDFDLKAQYETSHDIMPIASPVGSHVQEVCPVTSSTGGNLWSTEICKQMGQKIMIKPDTTDQTTGPTLAELNLDLLDDIETYINVDMIHSPPSGINVDKKPEIKEEPTFTKVENYPFVIPTSNCSAST